MQMLTLRNIHWTIDLLWSWGLWCCWSTNHKSYCGGMWTWRTPQQCWLRGRQVHLGHRLGVLASLLVNIALKLHSEESKYTSATPRCTCFPPRATSTQVPLVQVQVPKSNSASPRWTWGLGLGLGGLERSQWWAPRATSAQVPLVQVQVPKSNSASPRWTWGLGLGLGGLERSRPSPPPPAVGLIPKSFPAQCVLHTFGLLFLQLVEQLTVFTFFLFVATLLLFAVEHLTISSSRNHLEVQVTLKLYIFRPSGMSLIK